MTYLIFKYAVTAGLVVLISEVAKRSDKLGSLIASLPLVTLLTLIWLHVEQHDTLGVLDLAVGRHRLTEKRARPKRKSPRTRARAFAQHRQLQP